MKRSRKVMHIPPPRAPRIPRYRLTVAGWAIVASVAFWVLVAIVLAHAF